MSLKSIDMQFAVHKSSEVAMKQNQLQHKPVVDQTLLAEQLLKNTEKDRRRSVKVDQTEGKTIYDEQQSQKNLNKRGTKKKVKQNQSIESATEHPFKGKHIDFSL